MNIEHGKRYRTTYKIHSIMTYLIMLFPASCLAARILPWCGGDSNADKIAASAALPLSIVKGAAYISCS